MFLWRPLNFNQRQKDLMDWYKMLTWKSHLLIEIFFFTKMFESKFLRQYYLLSIVWNNMLISQPKCIYWNKNILIKNIQIQIFAKLFILSDLCRSSRRCPALACSTYSSDSIVRPSEKFRCDTDDGEQSGSWTSPEPELRMSSTRPRVLKPRGWRSKTITNKFICEKLLLKYHETRF